MGQRRARLVDRWILWILCSPPTGVLRCAEAPYFDALVEGRLLLASYRPHLGSFGQLLLPALSISPTSFAHFFRPLLLPTSFATIFISCRMLFASSCGVALFFLLVLFPGLILVLPLSLVFPNLLVVAYLRSCLYALPLHSCLFHLPFRSCHLCSYLDQLALCSRITEITQFQSTQTTLIQQFKASHRLACCHGDLPTILHTTIIDRYTILSGPSRGLPHDRSPRCPLPHCPV